MVIFEELIHPYEQSMDCHRSEFVKIVLVHLASCDSEHVSESFIKYPTNIDFCVTFFSVQELDMNTQLEKLKEVCQPPWDAAIIAPLHQLSKRLIAFQNVASEGFEVELLERKEGRPLHGMKQHDRKRGNLQEHSPILQHRDELVPITFQGQQYHYGFQGGFVRWE